MKDEDEESNNAPDHHLLSRRMSTVYDDDQIMQEAMRSTAVEQKTRKTVDGNKTRLEPVPSHQGGQNHPSGSLVNMVDHSVSVDLDDILNDLAESSDDDRHEQ